MLYRHVLGCLVLLGTGLVDSAAVADESKARLPVPDVAARAKSLAEIKSVMADDYAKLPKQELAKKLLTFGQGTKDDPTRRYVFFLEAGIAAIAAADGPVVCEAVDAITKHYQTGDPLVMKTNGLESAAKVVTKDEAKSLVTFLFAFSAKTIEADQFELADRILTAAQSIATRYHDRELVQQVTARQKKAGELHKVYAEAAEAQTKLARQPTDAAANRVAGKYFALAKGDWDKGLPFLALGDDANLKTAAALDLAQPTDTDKRIELADQWWDLSEKATDVTGPHLRARSAHWYEKALPAIRDDFAKLKVQKRLKAAAKRSKVAEPGAARPSAITNCIGMNLKLIPAGTFLMGSPKAEKGRKETEKQHRVRITQSFYLGIHEVTQGQYQQVMGSNPSSFASTGRGSEKVARLDTSRFPVEMVSWYDSQEFCRRLSEKEGETYRLPTEAEWEYACRAGTTTPFGSGARLKTGEANYNGTSTKSTYLGRSAAVGCYPPNAFGLYDMHGNAWEWCQDCYDKQYYNASSAKDPRGPDSGSTRVIRGGGWNDVADACRSAERNNGVLPAHRGDSIGFRVVRVIEGSPDADNSAE